MYDSIVVGGGHNGLVAAWYLARGGHRVLVLERRALVGGACTTEEITDGVSCSTTSYVCSMLHPAVVEDLELVRHGFEIVPATPTFMPLPDGRQLTLGEGEERDRAELAGISARDAEAYPRFQAAVERAAAVLRPTIDMTPFDPLRPRLSPLVDLARLGRSFRRLSEDDQRFVVKAITTSAADLLGEWFESPLTVGALGAGGTIGIPGSPSTPGTAFVLMHYELGQAAGEGASWGHVKGGMGAITQAMSAACRDIGVEVRLEADVASIVVKAGRVRGVRLADGETISSPRVLSNADPRATFLRLLDPGRLSSSFRRAIDAYRATGTSAKVNLALRAIPEFSVRPGRDHLRGSTQIIGDGLPYLERAFHDFQTRGISRAPYLDITLPTIVDSSLVADDRHAMSVAMKYASYVGAGERARCREVVLEAVLSTLETYAPNLRELVIAAQVFTPGDFEAVFGLSGGNVVHGDMALDQMFSLRPAMGASAYRTPVEGLYLCGAGTHPGGGVSGAPGRNAAHTVLAGRRRLPRLRYRSTRRQATSC
jgi:phytoene dehydrogenase-like protein